MWIGVLWAGLRVAMWITHVGGKFRHGLLEKSLMEIIFFWGYTLKTREGPSYGSRRYGSAFSGPMKSGHFPWNCPPQFQGKSRKGHDL